MDDCGRKGLRRLFLDHRFVLGRRFGSRLRSAVRALGERRLDLLDRLGLGQSLHGGDLTRQPVKRALETLKGRARIKRTMWSRRAQEYEAKINSGDIVAIAEVVRDLYRSESQPEQSYSERQLYEAALDRLSREVAAVQRLTETEAIKEIEAALAKGPHRGPKPAAEAPAEDDTVVEEEAA